MILSVYCMEYLLHILCDCSLSNKFFKDISAIDSSIAQLLLASIILLPYVIYQGNSWSMSGFSLLSLVILGIIHTGIAYLLYFSSLQELPAQKVAIFSI